MKNLPGIIYLCALRDLKRMCHRKLYPQITETPTTETANGKLSPSLSISFSPLILCAVRSLAPAMALHFHIQMN